MPAPAEFLQYVDSQSDAFIGRLSDAVSIASISGDAAYRPKVVEMSNWLNAQLQAVGVTTKQIDLGTHVMDGQTLPIPPAILGRIGEDRSKKTVLVYGHFDVQPASKSDGWDTDPFVLTKHEDGRLIGRGSTDDKGPIMGWVNVLQWHHETQTPLPVNLVFCFEGMEEMDSEGLDDLVVRERDGWFKGVDCVCISDNYWLNTRTPALTYGLRGLVYFRLSISGPGRDLHSGVFGRTVHEPMTDLISLMSRLVDQSGNILIPGVDDMIGPAGAEELALYEKLDYSIGDVESAAGGKIALSDDKATVLMGRMRLPSLSLHGIEGAFAGPGAKTVIPAKVGGKFSIRPQKVGICCLHHRAWHTPMLWLILEGFVARFMPVMPSVVLVLIRLPHSLVPPQTPAAVEKLVRTYIESEFVKLGTKNTMQLELLNDARPWVADWKHWNYEAAKTATEAIYKQTPDLMREGGSIPVTLTFAETLNVNVLLLPMGRGDDGAHSTNEKIDTSNYIEGTKLLGTYLYEVAAHATA
ncbi:CNDP dipeptidase [Favolaschia claudopus]|uniref:CNDP dipeptidase n=1 Tax=Favolaschia claudopus TaxID=2862362 RepID=A0AAW0D7B2_9AGAR